MCVLAGISSLTRAALCVVRQGWGLTGLSWTRMVGSTTAVIGLDSRGERTREQIIRPASWAAFQDQVRAWGCGRCRGHTVRRGRARQVQRKHDGSAR